jgi:hypothetical protein
VHNESFSSKNVVLGPIIDGRFLDLRRLFRIYVDSEPQKGLFSVHGERQASPIDDGGVALPEPHAD